MQKRLFFFVLFVKLNSTFIRFAGVLQSSFQVCVKFKIYSTLNFEISTKQRMFLENIKVIEMFFNVMLNFRKSIVPTRNSLTQLLQEDF